MLPLEQLYALSGGGALLSRFAMAVKKIVFSVADQTDMTTKQWLLAQRVAKDRNYQLLASQVIDYASSQQTALSEKGDALSDAEIESIVSSYLTKVVRLIA